jgi:hypothetical protein
VLVFLLASLAVYGWGRVWSPPDDEPRTYTSTAVVSHDAALLTADAVALPRALRAVEQRIAAATNVGAVIRELEDAVGAVLPDAGEAGFLQTLEDVRERMAVRATGGAGGVEVAVACTHADPHFAALVSNSLAQRYAQQTRGQWQSAVRETYVAARREVEQAEGLLTSARAELDRFVEERLKALAVDAAKSAEAAISRDAAPAQVVNPDWLALSRQIEQMQLRRANLLLERTRQHPAIQAADQQIEELRQQLAATPQWIDRPAAPAVVPDAPATALVPGDASDLAPLPPPVAAPPAITETVEYQSLRGAVSAAADGLQAAQQRETAAWNATQREPRLTVALAQAQLPAAPAGVRWGLTLTALAVGAAAAMVVAGVGRLTARPPLVHTVAQLQTLVHAPAVVLIPSADKG